MVSERDGCRERGQLHFGRVGDVLQLRPCYSSCTLYLKVLRSDTGLNQIHLALWWRQPGLEAGTALFLVKEEEINECKL